jgi:hypothetical protein
MTPDEIKLVHTLRECRSAFASLEPIYGMFPTDGHVFEQAIETCRKLVMARATMRQFPGLYSAVVNGPPQPGELAYAAPPLIEEGK